MSTPALNPLVTKIRGMHPGVYDDMDDATLTKKVLAKYPQYSDMAAGAPITDPKQTVGAQMQNDSTRATLAGVPGGSTNVIPASDTAVNVAGAGLGAAALGVNGPTVAAAGAKALRNHPILATAGLEAAKHIPVVGKYASMIPTWLPLLAGGKPSAAIPEAAEAGEAEAAIPSPPPKIPPQSAAPPKPIDDAFFAGPRPVIQKGPIPGSREDRLESSSIEDGIRSAAENEGHTIASQNKREWFGNNQPGSSKGDLTGQIAKPVKYTKTPGVKPGTVIPSPDEDLTPILQKSLQQARQRQ